MPFPNSTSSKHVLVQAGDAVRMSLLLQAAAVPASAQELLQLLSLPPAAVSHRLPEEPERSGRPEPSAGAPPRVRRSGRVVGSEAPQPTAQQLDGV